MKIVWLLIADNLIVFDFVKPVSQVDGNRGSGLHIMVQCSLSNLQGIYPYATDLALSGSLLNTREY